MTANPEPEFDGDDLDLLDPGPDAPVVEQMEHHLFRLAGLRGRIAEAEAERDRMVARYDTWFQRVTKPLADQIAWREALVRSMMEARLDSDPKAAKSLRLPSGTVASRKGSVVVEVDDESAFVEWALKESKLDLLRVPGPPPPPKPSKDSIKTALTDGEVLPGCRLVENPRSITITIDDPDDEL